MIFDIVLVATALAGSAFDCQALQKQLPETSPALLADAYVKIAKCDSGVAKSAAAEAFPRMIPGDTANDAAIAAIRVGSGAPVRDWVGKLEPDLRSTTIKWLGSQCNDEPKVGTFFVETKEAIGQRFFDERWYRGLADCRTPGVQTFLSTEIERVAAPQPGRDRAQFLGLLEVYARNLGAAAVPTLGKLARTLTDPEEVTYVISAFADSANVGSVGGMNVDAAAKATAELSALGPGLPPKAVDQARATLLALGADEVANGFATYRWPDRKMDGRYRYAVTVVEKATCKNGKNQAIFHHAVVLEPGKVWPEQLKESLPAKVAAEWGMHAADACKGTGETSFEMTGEPLAGDAELKAWIDAQRRAFNKLTESYAKVEETEHKPIEL